MFVMQGMTLLVRVNLPPYKPYTVATFSEHEFREAETHRNES